MVESRSKENHIFLLAHPDDEVFVLWHIRDLSLKGYSLIFIYLTGRLPNSKRRENESLSVLGRWANNHNVYFLGEEMNIADGTLVYHLFEAYQGILNYIAGLAITNFVVYSPCYEGGHPDHDACYLLNVTLTKNLAQKGYQFSLYHGKHTTGRFFSAAKPIDENGPVIERKLTFSEIFSLFRTCFKYPSQWKTWAGLLIPFAYTVFYSKALYLQKNSPVRIQSRPHDGKLLYERYNRLTYEDFNRAVLPFLEKNIAPFP